MIWIFFIVLIVTSLFLAREEALGRKAWVTLIVSATLVSFLFAIIAISSVWTPHPLSDDVFRRQDTSGNYRGTFPWSQFSCPLTLMVFHTPFQQAAIDMPYAHGKAEFSIDLAGLSLMQVKGNYTYLYGVQGPMPMTYQIKSIFSQSLEFFSALVALFTVFNFLATVVGIMLAKTFHSMCWHRRGQRQVLLAQSQTIRAPSELICHVLARKCRACNDGVNAPVKLALGTTMVFWHKPATLHFLFLKNLRSSKSHTYSKPFSTSS